jgi:CRP-like cAMP-binding protein
METRHLLANVHLFGSVEPPLLELIAQRVRHRRYRGGEVIFHRGDPGDALYIILSGRVKVHNEGPDGNEVIITVFSDGDYFGEMSLLDGSERKADVTTLEPTEMLVLTRDDLLNCLREAPDIPIHLLETVAGRLLRINEKNQATETRFYITGGTLPPNAPSYIERQADRVLLEALQHGEFCYVLNSRQMGKSSLMARTAHRLREAGAAVAILDLSAIGQELSSEQWYYCLLDGIGQELQLEDELAGFWREHGQLGPLPRWMAALQQVVLAQVPGRVVIFVDEIDVVRRLPFSTDEFFAAIRSCYNRRAQDPEISRLTFCLLGVATPADLIQDSRITPFNIGQRIELEDFSEAEAAPLAQGLGQKGRQGSALLKRVLYWTGGHPYLTQRLCQAVAEDGSVTGPGGVDRWCEKLFLLPRSEEQDDNLLFVRERCGPGEPAGSLRAGAAGQAGAGGRDESMGGCPAAVGDHSIRVRLLAGAQPDLRAGLRPSMGDGAHAGCRVAAPARGLPPRPRARERGLGCDLRNDGWPDMEPVGG